MMIKNLYTGLRLCLFLPIDIRNFQFRWGLFWFALFLDTLICSGIDFLMVPANPEFSWLGLQTSATSIFILLLASFAIANSFQRPALQFQIPILFLYSVIYIDLIYLAWVWTAIQFEISTIYNWMAFYLLVTWQILISFRVLFHLTEKNLVLQITNALILNGALIVPFFYLDHFQYWQSPNSESSAISYYPQHEPIDAEQVLFQQAKLIDKALSQVKPSDRQQPNLYFVVFAGDATQDVFKKEAHYSHHLLDQSFDTDHRSITLINHSTSVLTTPLATATNLEATLKGLNEKIDEEKDVLFLFVTTHGQPGSLAVDFPGLPLNQLTTDRLADALATSHFRYKVLLLSACFSGSFIEPLKNEDTMIITAARADRPSFGCSDTSDFTYFGKAFFAEALPYSSSFKEAFELAKRSVTEWELRDQYTPSEPQIFIGSEISQYLPTLESSLFKPEPGSAPKKEEGHKHH